MFDLPKEGFLGKTAQLVRYAAKQKVSTHAAHACYFMVLAAFPSLVLLLGLLRYSGLQAESLVRVFQGIFPQALLPQIQDLVESAYYSTTGVLVSVSAVTALWSASRGIYGLLSGLNAIYGAQEDRGYVRIRLVSVFYTLAFLVLLQITLVLHVFGQYLLEMLQALDGFWLFLADVVDLRFFFLFLLQSGLFTAMFMVLPNRKNGFMESLPGALLASIGWLVFSDLYSIYVERYAAYTNVFGSVYAVALSMLWLYCCISILFYGGVLNRWISQHVNKK